MARTKRLKLRPSGGDAFLPADLVRNRCSSLVCGGEKVEVDVDVGARIYSKSSLGKRKAAAAATVAECRSSGSKQQKITGAEVCCEEGKEVGG